MSDNQDPLNQLWQQQEVVQADMSELSKKWRKVKYKQRFYVLLDTCSVIIPSAFVWFSAEKLDRLTMIFMFVLLSLSVLWVVYVTWLRRFSLGWSGMSTEQHTQRLQKQIESNIKIANLSLHSVWMTLVLMSVFHGALYYVSDLPTERLNSEALVSLGLFSVMLPCIWVWASKRKKRFIKELAELKDLLRGSSYTN